MISKLQKDIATPIDRSIDQSYRLESSEKMARAHRGFEVTETQPPPKGKNFTFKYSYIQQRFQLYIHDPRIQFVELSKELKYALGYDRTSIKHGEIACYAPDPSAGINQLFIYAPKLVENSIVGDSAAPLLRVVNIRGVVGEMIEEIYISEHRLRLAAKRFSEISIEIRSSNGNFIKFNWGNCILTLHFQRTLF